MQDCGGRWRRVVSCIMNNAKAEPQAVPVLPLGWLNDSQSRKNRWLAVHASGSRACHIPSLSLSLGLCSMRGSIEIKLHRRDWFSCFSIDSFAFSLLSFSLFFYTTDRWIKGIFFRKRIRKRLKRWYLKKIDLSIAVKYIRSRNCYGYRLYFNRVGSDNWINGNAFGRWCMHIFINKRGWRF